MRLVAVVVCFSLAILNLCIYMASGHWYNLASAGFCAAMGVISLVVYRA